ncbi:MAG TPA: AMP-binding protein [Acidimicrobiales bacterium]|jgi:long-chain acyl-CoA synthetase
MNVGQAIDPAVAAVPERTALVAGDRRCSYGDLDRWVRRVAAALTARGVGPGDRVALVDTGSVLSVATILAAARIGAASAQMNVLLTPDELRALATAVGARIGVAGDPYRSNLAAALGHGAVLGEDDVPGTDRDGDDLDAVGGIDSGDDALILFTSGTTGRPKPVPISHGVIAERLGFYGTPVDPGAPPVVDMLSAPIFHIGGTLGLLIGLHSGRTIVMLPRFTAGAWLEAVEQHGVSQTFVVPTMLQRILDHPEFGRRDLSSLRQISYGAAAAPVALVERALDALGDVRFVNTFGQTETLGAYAALSAEDHLARHKLGTAGKPFPGVELRIVDVTTGTDCPAGTTGQVWVRAAQNVTRDWLRTGDLAFVDTDGYLHPVGRMSDTINRGGEKLGPIEVEEVLRRHPAVRDAGVCGVPDPELGERVAAVVVTVDGEDLDPDDLRAFAAERLARYKLPERIVFAGDLPYSNLGKVSRRALAAIVLAREGTG